MELAYIIAIIAGVVCLVVGLIVLGVVWERRRREALERVASDLGLGYQRDASHLLHAGYASLHLFRQGRRPRASNAMHGRYNRCEVDLFDYQYATGSGKDRRTIRQSVAAFHLPEGNLPGFTLGPENIFSKIRSAFGYADINFDNHPTFSKRYLLRGQDKAAIRDLFKWHILEFFEQHDKLCVQAVGQSLIVYRTDIRLGAGQIRGFLREASEVSSLFGG